MLPEPLHPAVVHLPLALAVLLPLVAAIALVGLQRGALSPAAWAAVAGLAALLAGSAWVAIETGEDEEERVERVVAEAPLEEHEERAETFLWICVGALALAGAGLLPGRLGRSARAATLAAALVVTAAAVRVGHSGGELVYRHGAARAYSEPELVRRAPEAHRSHELEEDDD